MSKLVVNTFAAILLSSMFNLSVTAQRSQYAEVSIASPTAASLGKYADIPVNYHTGIPQIEIPIYTIKEGSLSLPISLNYHAGGIKVAEPAGWVGAGWSLNAGGVITRSVRGAPDESGTSNAQKGHFSDYGYSSYLTIGGSGGYPSSSGPTAPNDYNFQLNIFDGEPDLYFFNFAGYSGKFYFDDDRTPIIVGGEDLKIEYYFPKDDPNDPANTHTGISSNIYGFIITVPNGDKYYFGINKGGTASGANPVEITFPYSANHTSVTDNVFSSWYLNKIVSADGMFTINLTYQPESYSYYSLATFPIKAENPTPAYEYDLVKNNIQGVRLSQISYSNGKVDFIPSVTARTDLGRYISGEGLNDYVNTEAKALGSISISNSNNSFCKNFKFAYSYFQDNTTSLATPLSYYNIQTDRYRLKLDMVTEQNCDSSQRISPYKFEYYNTFLPRRLSFAQDHWGFYNGANNATLIPTYSIDTYNFISGADRDSKWPEMQSGALTKITYPTGGTTSLEFEPNTTWVNATRYNSYYRFSYSVGYDGNNNADWSNVPFTGNYYKVVMSNNPCPSSSTSCGASVSLISAAGSTVFSLSAAGGESTTGFMQVPAGNYRVHLSRSAVQSGSGAQAAFYEVIPTSIQQNVVVGGLRIKTIAKNDGTGKPNEVTSFSYDVNGQSSGILYSRPSYVQTVRNDILSQEGFPGNTSYTNNSPHGCLAVEGSRQPYFKSPCGVIPMATSQGNHIGYNEVTVSQVNNGYSVYRYYGSNLWDVNHDDVAYRNIAPLKCDFTIPNVPAAPLPFEYQRGMLKYEGHFNQSGQRLKDIQYTYVFDSTKIATPAYMVQNILGAMLGTMYESRGYWKKQTQTIETDCVPGGACIQTTKNIYYESPYHRQPTRIMTADSKGGVVETRSKYAFDYRLSNCDAISDGSAAYLSACSSCDATMNAKLSTNITQDYRFIARVDNKICRADARKNYAALRVSNFTGLTNAFKSCHASGKQNANSDLKPILELQDQLNNALIEKTDWRNGLVGFGEFYKYDFLSIPSTTAYLSKVQLLHLASPVNNYTISSVGSNTSVIKDSRYGDELSYLFANGNIVEKQKVNDVRNVYLWGYNSRYPVAKILGSDYNTAKQYVDQNMLNNAAGYTDAQIRAQLNNLRTNLPQATVVTYTYKPEVGITSETDPSGKTTYYEYDAFGRLKLIRDQNNNIVKQFDYKYQGQ